MRRARPNRVIPELDPPPFPKEIGWVWLWFKELDAARQSGFGINPISHQEMFSYFWLHNLKPTIWEISVIRQLDGISIAAASPSPTK